MRSERWETSGRGHVAGRPVAGDKFFEDGDLFQAAGFLGAHLSRAQYWTPGVEAAAGWNIRRVRGFAGQDLVGPAATDPRGYGDQGSRVRM